MRIGKEYFEANKNKMSSIWKGIRSIVNINNSTSHALINMTEFIKDKLDTGHPVGGLFIDLEKSFNTINHEILNFYGFRGISQILLNSFLTNQKQYISINGFDSTQLPVKCGVPQGSTQALFYLFSI